MTHLSRTLAIALLAGAGVASMASALKPAPTATPTPALVAPALEFVTEEFPPLNFNNKDGQADGFGSELVREILRRNGLTAPLTVLPWARAYKTAQTQANVGLYCTVRNDEREAVFQWVGPIGYITSVLYINAGSSLRPVSLSDARAAHNVIALRDGYSAQLLRRMGFDNVMLANNNTDALRLMTTGGDQTLLLVSSLTVARTLAKLGLPGDAIKPVLTVMRRQLYIAFSLGTAPAVVKRFQATLDEMKHDGSFVGLHRKWFPGEKPPGFEREADVSPE